MVYGIIEINTGKRPYLVKVMLYYMYFNVPVHVMSFASILIQNLVPVDKCLHCISEVIIFLMIKDDSIT